LWSSRATTPATDQSAITVLSPSNGQTFKAGNPITITWTGGMGVSQPGDVPPPNNSVDISLVEDPATAGACLVKGEVQPVAGEVTGGTFTLSDSDTSKISQGATCRLKVRIESTVTSASAESDGYFTITP